MKLMERILRLVKTQHASDIFLAPHAPVLIKVDGQTRPINDQMLPEDGVLRLLGDVLAPTQLTELKTQGELNVAIQVPELGRFRVSAFRQRGLYSAVVRPVTTDLPTLKSLHLPPLMEQLALAPRGLVLLTGPAGSGKSSSLAAMLEHRNLHSPGHILTIEDPVEFLLTNKRCIINQREVGTDATSMEVALANGMRQAPDVLMIGEVHDRHTMAAALNYAQTGHLCLGTLHASSAVQALNRIASMYPAEVRGTVLTDLAGCLRAIVSQRLVPAIKGGRVPAVEILLNTAHISSLIEKGDFLSVRESLERPLTEGSQCLEAALAHLVHDGLTTREAAVASADSPSGLVWRLQNRSMADDAEHAQNAEREDGTHTASFKELAIDTPAPR